MTRQSTLWLRSFRVRIALLSTLLAGMVLLAFGWWTWEAVQRVSAMRIDQSIRELGNRHLAMRQGPLYWQYVRESLEFVLGEVQENPFILLVRGRDGQIIHISDNWPPELAPETFPTPIDAGFTEDPERWGPPRGWRHGQQFGRRQFNPPPSQQAPENPAEPPPEARPSPATRPPRPMPIRSEPFYTSNIRGTLWRIGVMSNPEITLVLGINLASYTAEMNRLRLLYLVAAPAALLLIALGGWLLAQRALIPVHALTETAQSITVQGLNRRIPIRPEDAEFGRLISVFNDMLDRLEKSFKQAVRFSADAAHELKTPLTILQGELTQALQTAPDNEQQQVLSHLLDEVQRLKTITRKLLLLSLADSGQLKPHMEPINLSELVAAQVEDAQVLAPYLIVRHTIAPDLWVAGDPDLIRQVVQNLASNSIKFNVRGGTIEIELRRDGDKALLRIGNSGAGIPENERDRVFDRFYRADKARNRRVDGMGLGLSLSREIVRAHGGELVLERADTQWTRFLVALPAFHAPSHSQDS